MATVREPQSHKNAHFSHCLNSLFDREYIFFYGCNLINVDFEAILKE